MSSQKVNYGIDAPGVVTRFTIFAVLGVGGGRVLLGMARFRGLGRALITMGIWFGLTAIVMLASSLWWKFRMRRQMLDAIPWRGDEQVLDVGCGHGLMLLGAARRLSTGRATGVDIWSSNDQADNSKAATEKNAELEGVADRVVIRDGDARKLPFRDGTFDVVVSSLAIHNISKSEERDQAIAEIARVTKPGGYVAIADIMHSYRKALELRGFTRVRSGFSLMFALPTFMNVMKKS